MGRKIILKDEASGRYITGGPRMTDDRSLAKVWDWDADDVEHSVKDVKDLYGATWLVEDAPFKLPESITSIVA